VYDGRGNRTQRRSWTRDNPTAAYEPVTESWTYNDDDQPLTSTPPTGGATSYTYNSFGQLATITQPSQRVEARSYRNDGQLSQRQFTQPGADTITWGYKSDAAGRRTQATDTTGSGPTYTSTWSLDRLGRVVTQSTPNRGAVPVTYATVASTFDLAGNRYEMQHPDGTKYRYNHDSYGRIIGTHVYVGANCCVALAVYNYTYAGGDRAEDWIGGTSAQFRRSVYNIGSDGVTPNGFDETILDTPTNRTRSSTMTWRPDARLATETNTTNGGTPETVNYSYDTAGQLTCAATGAACPTPTTPPPATDTCTGGPTGTVAYTYNARGMRMCTANGATVTTYHYNDNAELQTTAATDPTQSSSYRWDLDGRRTGTNRNNGAVDVDTVYDPAGNPRTLTTTVSGTPVIAETRTYSATDQLVRHDLNGTASDYTWSDLPDPTGVPQIIEARQNGATWTRVNYGKTRLSVQATGDPAPSYLFYDQRTSTLPTSKIAAPTGYEPYGKGTGPTVPYAYIGYRSELVIGDLIHLRNRDYDPTTGTFTTRDDLDGIDGRTTVANPYHYTDNDPLNKTDPLGLRADDCTMASGLCVIDDLGGAFGTTNDQVKPGAGRIKSDHGDFFRQAGCILNQNCGLIYSVHDYTDEIYMAAIHAQIDTRLVYAIFAKESESPLEPFKDAGSSIGLDSDASAIGPSNVTEDTFNSVVARHGDIFGGAQWWDVTKDKMLAAKVTAFRLRDLNDDLNGSIARNNVTRIFRPHGCERRGESPDAAVFCRSTLLTFAYTKKFDETVGGALFDRIFTGRSYVSHGNKEFVPAPGSLTNAATHYMGDAWDYYCGSGGFFLC
jgi:RHS repeat-associated protein